MRNRGHFWRHITGWGLLALLIGMGRFSPGLYQLCYEVLPYFDKFRVPVMILCIQELALIVLAVQGLVGVLLFLLMLISQCFLAFMCPRKYILLIE